MSYLGDVLSFERFNLGDWWKKIKANPEQLVIGAGDPFSAKMWGGITGKDYEPFVDQMGGPFGGNAVSAFGANKGGVYGRAEDAGINTGPASNVHDAAHVVAAVYGGKGLMGIGGAGGGGSGAGSGTGAGTPSPWARMAGQMPGSGGQNAPPPPEQAAFLPMTTRPPMPARFAQRIPPPALAEALQRNIVARRYA